ncbi:ImmA/IrrE family metallo-endopeptidase [Endozoicomonas sp. 2B-B]
MTVANPMKKLVNRLASTGFSAAFINDLMPVWWDKSLEKSEQSMLLLKMHFSKNLGLDLASLLDNRRSIKFQLAENVHYKLTKNKKEDQLVLSQSLAISMAKLVASAAVREYKPLPKNAGLIRQKILKNHPWTEFDNLVDYCWSRGIPVIYLSRLPKGAKKFEGMVVDVDGRPVIVLAKKSSNPSWQLFILAHEIGHIGCGHVKEGAGYLDEVIDSDDDNSKEKEATAYGLKLLTGSSRTRIGPKSGRLTGRQLAKASIDSGRKHQVEPGHIALNYAHDENFIAVGNAALKTIGGRYDAVEYVRDALKQNIDEAEIPRDSRYVLSRLV